MFTHIPWISQNVFKTLVLIDALMLQDAQIIVKTKVVDVHVSEQSIVIQNHLCFSLHRFSSCHSITSYAQVVFSSFLDLDQGYHL
jgi:hypothetical protein